ncbi:MAG: DUF169 domain-containing protein, partial [Synergistaceae bacterium]|nr:DUF169 domain-containing protein [Synergistaceae bacterium]
MDFREFARELGIVGKVLSITRKNGVKTYCPVTKGCALRVLNDAMAGETVCLSEDVVPCNGGKYGFGFSDASMRVPGGYGHFISYGAGEGFPAGMRLKCDPELAERDALAKPKGVMDGYSAIEIKPFEESGGESDI